MEFKCYACTKSIELDETQPIMRSEECPHCYVSLRCCKMCEFYDERSYNECREPSAERIVEKEKANFCDFYRITSNLNKEQAKNDALAAANALFKK